MDLDAIARRAGIRFDSSSVIFNELLAFYLENVSRNGEKKVVAQGPLSPSEPIFAAGALPYDLVTRSTLNAIFNGGVGISQEAIDAQMSPEFSPWNLIMLGSVMSGQCEDRIDLFSTVLGGFDEQQAKSFHLMAQNRNKPCLSWEVPMFDPESESRAIHYLEKELELAFRWLSGYTGQQVTDKSLEKAIRAGNDLRRDMMDLDVFFGADQVPLRALEYYLLQIMLGDAGQDPQGLHILFRKLNNEIQTRTQSSEAVSESTKPVRVYYIGDETQELGIYNAIEEHGGALVGSNVRLPLYYSLIDETEKPLRALARWIWRMPNNLPAQMRIHTEIEFIRRQLPDAVIINSTVGSRFLPGFERLFKEILKHELNMPVLCVETSFPGENIDKVDYQISALMQTITTNY